MEDLSTKRPQFRSFKSQDSTATRNNPSLEINTGIENETTLDPNLLETGSHLSVGSRDGSASPRFASAIARISDRIAGSGITDERMTVPID